MSTNAWLPAAPVHRSITPEVIDPGRRPRRVDCGASGRMVAEPAVVARFESRLVRHYPMAVSAHALTVGATERLLFGLRRRDEPTAGDDDPAAPPPHDRLDPSHSGQCIPARRPP